MRGQARSRVNATAVSAEYAAICSTPETATSRQSDRDGRFSSPSGGDDGEAAHRRHDIAQARKPQRRHHGDADLDGRPTRSPDDDQEDQEASAPRARPVFTRSPATAGVLRQRRGRRHSV